MKSLRWLGLTLALLAATQLSARRLFVSEATEHRLGGPALRGGAPGERVAVAHYPLRPAGTVTVENIQGDITVEAWDRAEAEVVVHKQALGATANPDDVEIGVEADGRRLVLRTLYPQQSGEPVRVNYRLRVPRQVRLEHLQTVEGNIRVREIEGSVDARTLNGAIEGTSITGRVLARAINGSVAVSLRSLPQGSPPVQLETINGSLFLGLPAEAHADLQLTTVAGQIDTNYRTRVSEVPGDASRRITLGRGGTEIHLRTVRGNIHVAESEKLL